MVKGIYVGSFDPVHLGHVHFAVQACEIGGFDEIFVIPAHVSPFKMNRPPVDGSHRLAMCQLAFQGWPKARILSVEIDRSPPSFSSDTIRELQALHLGPLRLILASEIARSFHLWKDAATLVHLARPLVLKLRETSPPEPWPSDPISQTLAKQVIEIPSFDVSSTEVRERLRKGLWCGHLVPQNVLTYIHQHQLYYS